MNFFQADETLRSLHVALPVEPFGGHEFIEQHFFGDPIEPVVEGKRIVLESV